MGGVEAGATIVTHFPNAVSKLDDEGSTLLDLAMQDIRLFLELILDGHYLIGQLPVIVKYPVARFDSNGALAGSTLTMDRSFFNLQSLVGRPLVQAVVATSEVPARALGLHDGGAIAIGQRADLLEVDVQEERISIVSTG